MPASDERPVNAAASEQRFRPEVRPRPEVSPRRGFWSRRTFWSGRTFRPRLVSRFGPRSRFLAILLSGALVLLLVAWQRGAEYDEQYTLFLTSGVARPDWPASVFPAGLARELQSGDASMTAIAHDLRVTDVHPPLYFWLVALWRRCFGHDLFEARLLSVACGLGALALTGIIALRSRINPLAAMLFTLGCYGFAYTSVVARGFSLAQLLVLCGVAVLLRARRSRGYALAGALFGAAMMANYLAAFTACACVLTGCVAAVGDASRCRRAIGARCRRLMTANTTNSQTTGSETIGSGRIGAAATTATRGVASGTDTARVQTTATGGATSGADTAHFETTSAGIIGAGAAGAC